MATNDARKQQLEQLDAAFALVLRAERAEQRAEQAEKRADDAERKLAEVLKSVKGVHP